ncbi:hypothetical protein MMC09_003154 [Bachmanniomyces sp. S44760]|nr:hypothetical protein [Bachmanniomyces sp. S44760]
MQRKTRFVCVSDTHNASPDDGCFKLPKGDVLIHAGDLTTQGTLAELRRAVKWIDEADFEVKLVIAGNHEVTLDTDFYAQHALDFHNQHPQRSQDCIDLLRNSKSITYLNHECTEVRLTKPGGPQTTFKVFGSPYSPAKGNWAFGYQPEESSKLWDQIPLDADVVVTHTPPKHHCDEHRGSAGCEALRQTLWRVRPRLAICGHVHDGRGVERVTWDLAAPNIKFKEVGTEHWVDETVGTKKLSFVDLTAKGGKVLKYSADTERSENDKHDTTHVDGAESMRRKTHDTFPSLTKGPNVMDFLPTAKSKTAPITLPNHQPKSQESWDLPVGQQNSPNASSMRIEDGPSATRGQGGIPPSKRCDLEALSNRMGRKETCIINAAMMASSYPHKGGRKYNKPIVVDVDLPV